MPHALPLLLAALAPAADPPGGFADTVSLNFPRWDTDRDGTLSPAELDAAVLDRRYTAEAGVAVAVIKQLTLNPIYKNVTLTPAGLARLPRSAFGKDREKPGVDDLFASGMYRATQRHAVLFESGRPRLDTVRQGTIGNCFCLAPIGGLVHRDALAVARMFQPWPGGGYRVAFGDGRTATIPPLSDAELVLTGWNDRDGIWMNVYEKAVAEVRNRDASGKPRSGLALDATARGGPTGEVMELLTGHKTRLVGFRPPAGVKVPTVGVAEVRAMLKDASGKRLVCANTPPETATPGLTPQHAYAVLGFDPLRDVVTVWNPHGNTFAPKGPAGPKAGYATARGVFALPAAEFVELFEAVVVETADRK